MTQELLWQDSLADALSSGIERAGGFKRIGAELWPEKTAQEAGKELQRCLNADRREKLSLEQIELILRRIREAECMVPFAYINQTNDLEPPKAITKETARERLQREYIAAVQTLGKITDRMERVA